MGFKLRREVRDAIPAGRLTAGERLLVLELADICSDDTREGWPGITTLAKLTDMSDRSIQQTLNRVGKKWFELRVPLGTNADGKDFYAYAGKRTTYRFPDQATLEGAMDECPSGATDKWASDQNGATDRSGRCDGSVEKVRQMSGPSPQGTSLKINTSSLSAPEDQPPVAAVPTQRTERETDDASLKISKTHTLLTAAGCPAEHLNDTEEELRRRFPHVHSLTAYLRKVADNDELADLVADVVDALQPVQPRPSRRAFIDTLTGEPTCDHGVEGGNIPWTGDNGWMVCSPCRRQAGWVEVNNQGRTDGVMPQRKRSTTVLRAEQALEVADSLDRQFGHGRYAPDAIRSPADQRVADAIPMYEKYRALEEKP